MDIVLKTVFHAFGRKCKIFSFWKLIMVEPLDDCHEILLSNSVYSLSVAQTFVIARLQLVNIHNCKCSSSCSSIYLF